MAKKILFIITMSMLATLTQAQRNEMGVFAGAGFYLGDLNPTGVFSQSKPAFGLVYRYNFDTRWAMRINGIYGTVTASDLKYDNPRNLSFRSDIYELSAIAEVNFFTFFAGSKRRYRFSPYLFGGVGVFNFNPQAYYNGEWVNLRPLSTEGQGMPEYLDSKHYSTVQLAIPFGLGFKYGLSRRFTVAVEWGMRATLTDYLDDVSGKYVDQDILRQYKGEVAAALADRSSVPNLEGSQRGDPNKKDWYSFAGISITYKLYPSPDYNCPAYRNARARKNPSIFE